MKPITVKRYDVNQLTLGKNVRETAQGFLEITATTARTGIQRYRMDDGTVLKEFRPEDEVFSNQAIESLETSVITDGHPKEMVNPDNAGKLMVGFPKTGVEKVKIGDEFYPKMKLVVTHRDGIEAIRAGKAQLSHGYNVDLDFGEGEHNGERYDCTQRNIVNNHIALVWRARGGENAKLHLDSQDAILITDNDNYNEPKKGDKQMKIKVGDKEFEVSDELGAALKAEMAKMKKGKEDAEEEAKTSKAKADELETENEVLKSSKTKLIAKCDSLESELEKKETPKMDGEELDKAVKERISVMDAGKKILSKEEVEKLDEMDNVEIKKAVIKADSPKVEESKLEDAAYVDARFDHIVENFTEADDKKKKVADAITKTREDGNNSEDGYKSPEQIRQENMAKAKADSLGPIGVTKE